jgi:splicing factor 3B subunit 3
MEETILFNPRKLTNLSETDVINSLGCVTDFVVDDFNGKENIQIYTISGRSARSTLRILKHGLEISKDKEGVSKLPGDPIAVWTLKADVNDQFDKYIILAFQNSTIVLSVDGDNCKICVIYLVTNTGFKLNKPSLHVGLLEDNTFIQVIPPGILHIDRDKKARLYETKSRVLFAVSNHRQIVVALEDRTIVYFELEEDKLTMFERKTMEADVIIFLIFR